jgi:hypothetical protein
VFNVHRWRWWESGSHLAARAWRNLAQTGK